jgi:hypothetical protein
MPNSKNLKIGMYVRTTKGYGTVDLIEPASGRFGIDTYAHPLLPKDLLEINPARHKADEPKKKGWFRKK